MCPVERRGRGLPGLALEVIAQEQAEVPRGQAANLRERPLRGGTGSARPRHPSSGPEGRRDEEGGRVYKRAGGAAAKGSNTDKPKPQPNHKKEKLTVHLTHDLIERVKNAAYWNPRLTIAAIAERGIAQVIEQIERENGGPYPAREEELKGGRPIGTGRAANG